MPCLFIHTNVTVDDKAAWLAHCSSAVATALAKPEAYVMVALHDHKDMLFAGSDAPLAFIELKSLGLGSSQTAELSATLCALLEDTLHIEASRIYIEFAAPERSMFGWNSGTFS